MNAHSFNANIITLLKTETNRAGTGQLPRASSFESNCAVSADCSGQHEAHTGIQPRQVCERLLHDPVDATIRHRGTDVAGDREIVDHVRHRRGLYEKDSSHRPAGRLRACPMINALSSTAQIRIPPAWTGTRAGYGKHARRRPPSRRRPAFANRGFGNHQAHPRALRTAGATWSRELTPVRRPVANPSVPDIP
jgi:hypothetical protein